MYGRNIWEGLVTESTVRLNRYLEVTQNNDRRASGIDNNRQIWATQRISPAILHDKFRHLSKLPTIERSHALLNLWLSAVDFKPKMAPMGYMVNSWLALLTLLVMGMISAGGVTRLTRSGLSMTTWKFTGEKRPVTESDWEEEFDLYKQSPEWRLHNQEMELKDFKFIYHMEYGHRTLGRVIGVAFTVPLLFFLGSGAISLRTGFGKALVGVLSLGGLQGLIGWWMVKSGLDEKTNVEKARVSPYRLATHLTIAFTLLVGLTTLKLRARHGVTEVWLRDELLPKKTPNLFGFSFPRGLAHATAMVAFLTAMTGAFVAGNEAGLVYNEWPEMGGDNNFIPSDLFSEHLPWYRNIFENPTFVQFVHRTLAYTTFTFSWATAFASVFNKAVPGPAANAAMRTAALVTAQAGLGIYTLLNYVPTEVAALHQFGAMLVLMSATQTMYYSLNPVANISNLSESIRMINFANNSGHDAALRTMQSLQDQINKHQQTLSPEYLREQEAQWAAKSLQPPVALSQVQQTRAAAQATGAAKTAVTAAANTISKSNKSSALLFAAVGVTCMLPKTFHNTNNTIRKFKD
jgi:cytochrome c oxidase assembly protein subunit 15